VDQFLNRVISYLVYRWNQRVQLKPEAHGPLMDLLALLKPMQARSQRKIRIGSNRDGGYVMLDDFAKLDGAFSLGVGRDISWDYAIAERGIPVWQYDHTIDALPKMHPHFHFAPRKIVSQSSSPNEIELASLLKKWTGKQIIMKMDIEGDEWEVLSRLDSHLLASCRQLVIEFHDFLSVENPAWHDRARQALLVLGNDFSVVHVHANNISKHIVSHGLTLPDGLEVTFANRLRYQLEPTDETFPGPNDRKNNPYFPDFHLGRFQFGLEGEKK